MNNKMIVYKENIFIRIKKIFISIFRKSNETEKNDIEKQITSDNSKRNFIENIVVKQEQDDVETLNVQKDFKDGNILEKDIPENTKNRLIELYKKQNEQMKEKINIEKNQIRKMLNDLKVS